MEAKILNRGLKLIENFYNASMYTDDVWDNDLYRIKDMGYPHLQISQRIYWPRFA